MTVRDGFGVERVSMRLLCTKIDLQPIGREMLTVADCVAE